MQCIPESPRGLGAVLHEGVFWQALQVAGEEKDSQALLAGLRGEQAVPLWVVLRAASKLS